jgi:hypothetical protein
MEILSTLHNEQALIDRNETPQSMATTLAGGGNSEDQINSKKAHLDDQAIDATIARYAGNADSTVREKANIAGHSNARSMHMNSSGHPTHDSEHWEGKLLMEQAAMASVAQLSQRLLTTETCLHETINSRFSILHGI